MLSRKFQKSEPTFGWTRRQANGGSFSFFNVQYLNCGIAFN